MPDLNNDREWQRLLALYADKADEELLELHGRRNDLTELAQQALEKTMQQRGLEPEAAEDPATVGVERGNLAIGTVEGLEPGEISLITFRDGLEASQAVAALRGAELPHRITERIVRYGGGDSRTLLELIVESSDADRARALLQRTLGLFPPAEGDHPDGEGEEYMPLGEFTASQAAVVTKALEERGVAYVADRDQENPDALVWINVAAEQADEAFDLMEQIADTLPE